ncbi:adenosylcobinamide-phosphate synthase CbiB [Roseateles amylovorans]|uniref:Cobalamin biosynthesis protein CobD n=1 Tax=Roseateles amylovorans TaxID=2978473 RepID=A0ABY6AWA4_9BURK|nr:adenosylcobinamide-phosphate synthase CbiB [Roseateles amylovorans]UXH77456.1 adenosylcobinamide-phosphate synthase CbiB [Roseateles amylovorans]
MSWLFPLSMLMALSVDRLWGEPPTWAHPVVAMGRYLGLFKQRLCNLAPQMAFVAGALAWLAGAAGVIALALVIEQLIWLGLTPWAGPGHLIAAGLLMGLLLKPLLAWRMLREEVAEVEVALTRSLEDGQSQLARLVSRDTRVLSAVEVRETAIETLAENLNDSVIAPLFWFAIAGLPGAALYRFANTADAMWGYRGRWEWAGKWAARADDLMSWIPARLTGLALIVTRPAHLGRLLPRLWREAGRTPSPNGGWPMGAMALRLDRRLSKPGHYCLHADGGEVRAGDGVVAQRLASQALVLLTVVMAAAAAGMRGAWW